MALSEAQKAVLAAYTVEQRTRVESDGLKDQRCACGHIFYADDVRGGMCRFCGCANHRSAASEPQFPKDPS